MKIRDYGTMEWNYGAKELWSHGTTRNLLFKPSRRRPLGRHHHVELGLIPKVVAVRWLRITLDPSAHTIEILVEQNEVALRLVVPIAHRRDHHVAVGQTMDGVRSGHVIIAQHLSVDRLTEKTCARK